MERKLKELVNSAKTRIDLYKAPRKAIELSIKNPCGVHHSECSRNLNIAIVAAPCHGFGDIIFATKFARYIKYGFSGKFRGYSKNVTIVTPSPDMFTKLGVKDVKIVPLKGGSQQCRRLKSYNRPKNLKKFDLIFVAPLMADFKIDYADVKALFKESTPFNTIFLSEYQPRRSIDYDFATGSGPNHDGLLFDGLKSSAKLKTLGREPYALAYIAKDVGVPYCLSNFVKMIVAKYHKKYHNLQIVMPEWGITELSDNAALIKFVKKYYPNINLKMKSGTIAAPSGNAAVSTKNNNTLTLRGDILPVSRPDMLSLIKYSIEDILITGDQSITDVIDCCQQKNIWYQTVPWKSNFAKSLAAELPQKYLGRASTSCGTLKAIKWNRWKSATFKSRNDFRKKSKKRLDAIFRAATEAKNKNSIVGKYLDLMDQRVGKKSLDILLESY